MCKQAYMSLLNGFRFPGKWLSFTAVKNWSTTPFIKSIYAIQQRYPVDTCIHSSPTRGSDIIDCLRIYLSNIQSYVTSIFPCSHSMVLAPDVWSGRPS